MSFFSTSKSKAELAASKLAEEFLYSKVADEVANNVIRQGLWAKAISESHGNEEAAKASYIKLRVEMLKAEAELAEYVSDLAVKEATRESREAECVAQAERRAKVAESDSFDFTNPYAVLITIAILMIATATGSLLVTNF